MDQRSALCVPLRGRRDPAFLIFGSIHSMYNAGSTGIRIIIPIAIGAGGVIAMSSIAFLLDAGSIPLWTISRHEVVNFTFTMQMMVLPISFVAIALAYLYDRAGFKAFFRLGIKWSENNDWNVFGPIIAAAFTLGNAIFMAFSLTGYSASINNEFYNLIPLVLLLALTNAWSEEIFSRFVIVAGLAGKIGSSTICWISAIIFGLPHFFGTPSGFFGVIMSGLLGWLLAKSVLETKGLGWALFIHFLQDVVIFGAGALSLAADLQ